MPEKKGVKDKAKKIKLLILDVDGVMTDGSIILDNEGNEFKSFHVRDGHGLRMLMQAGVRVAIITGRSSKVVVRRARELGITDVFQKCRDKRVAYQKLLKLYSLDNGQVAYIGDDIVDLPVMSRVGLPVAVSDASAETKEYALLVTRNRGGRGAVREVTDLILKSQGLWKDIFNEYVKA
ncbi:MAG: 3-deoxy-manno-octulosonate-8-phosphatase KdsC [Nitrospirae bacterium]|nr:MAG: 3-deoxy-manno-octulosonate-8-phosphatase KdsC [Nitrospirota bacterium]